MYVLASQSQALVKVGKSNNAKRVPALVAMCYGGADDWLHVRSFAVDSNQAAIAVESMIHARLANQGFRRDRFPWVNRLTTRPSFADECFTCTPEHAIKVGEHMVSVYSSRVA
ncbi:GIY-YIG nuclease family protein [Xanthomonas axonopodis pv. poinsettiicola]|uniref:GIY-YIG nuclease family protein n=1 Tax=Xanthomonas axonopodis TaxID=53413 RepID=UPI003558D7D8